MPIADFLCRELCLPWSVFIRGAVNRFEKGVILGMIHARLHQNLNPRKDILALPSLVCFPEREVFVRKRPGKEVDLFIIFIQVAVRLLSTLRD